MFRNIRKHMFLIKNLKRYEKHILSFEKKNRY